MVKTEEILESLSPIERKVLPYIRDGRVEDIQSKSGMDSTSILRALQFLEKKGIIKKEVKKNKIVEIDDNGRIYLGEGLPERKLLNVIFREKRAEIQKLKKESGLDDNEFNAALGALKGKALVNVENGGIVFFGAGAESEASGKMIEEKFLESLPKNLGEIKDEQKLAYENLSERKGIIKIKEIQDYSVVLTPLGKEVLGGKESRAKSIKSYEGMIEGVTPEIIKSREWKERKFRRYDVESPVPEIHGGKKHFVNQAVEYGKRTWMDMGFKEMTGKLTQTGFWNFDALFTAQDHPVREMQDTFYIKSARGRLPEKKVVEAVKKSHEGKVGGSRGWGYKWKEDEARKVVLRTHTTCLSAQTLAKLGELKNSKNKEGKYFAIGMNFRNETLDWSHGFQFNQSEGIVVGRNLNFRHLLGYLKEFFRKMGYEKIRFRPSYFPYTEPSVEIEVWNSEKKVWLELGGAGMFRPEVTIPLLGEHIPVLAWGPGFDRTIMEYYEIKDLREMYENDLNKLRKKKAWMK